MKFKNLFVVVLLLLLSTSLFGQNVLTNDTLINMKKSGLSDKIINAKISSEPVKFNTSLEAILELKKHGFSDETIELMIERNSKIEKTETEDIPLFPTTIEEKDSLLVVNKKYVLSKGDELQVYLPFAGKDFVSISEKKSNAKLIGRIAGAVGTGALAVGLGTNSLGTLSVMRSASAIEWGADAISQIENLPISSTAKKIAGKKLKIIDWKQTQEGFVLNTQLEKKKYTVVLSDAIMLKEITLTESVQKTHN